MEAETILTCPRCGTSGHFHRAEIEERSNGLAMLLVGGIWPYLLSRPSNDMYICSRCHYVFQPDPRINKWVALGIVILCAIMVIAPDDLLGCRTLSRLPRSRQRALAAPK